MSWRILPGDCRDRLRDLPSGSVQCVVTSPPYFGLRDYNAPEQIGLEPSAEEYVQALCVVFRDVRRVLRSNGTLWLNLGDTYREKSLQGIPWQVALALKQQGWILRSEVIWSKPNLMPESISDRPTRAHEQLFLLTKQATYYYDADAIKERATDWSRGGPGVGIKPTKHYGAQNGGNAGLAALAQRYRDGSVEPTRNRRTVWQIPWQPYPGAHFAVFPTGLVEPCVMAGSRPGDMVLDPFAGSGTVGVVCEWLGRDFTGIELNPEYAQLAERRISIEGPLGRSPSRPREENEDQLAMFPEG